MTDEAVEAVARALSGHFGPDFDDLPKGKIELRAQRRRGGDIDHTQADILEAAADAIAAYEANRTDVEELLEALKRVRNGLRSRDSKDRVVQPVRKGRLIEIIDEALTRISSLEKKGA